MSFKHDAALKVRERNDFYVKTTEPSSACVLGTCLLLMTDEGLFLIFSTTELKGILQYSAKLTAV